MTLNGRSLWTSITRFALFSRLAALLLLSCSPPVFAQQAVDALRQSLVGQTLTVKIPGIHAATRVLVSPIDNRVVNGAVQKRGLDLLRGSGDFHLPPGAMVRVVTVEAATDRHVELIRIGVNVPAGGYAPIAFVLDHGLASATPAQLAAMISPVLGGAALDTMASAEATPAVAPPATAAAVAPPAPAHPANTVVDFPPAAPGYPALHASAPAEPGCWWEPWLSTKFHLEMLVKHCAAEGVISGWNNTYLDADQGVSVREPGSSESIHLFDVVTKRADQPLPAVLQQKFIAPSKDANVRQWCKPLRDTKQAGPVEFYTIEATGAYAKQKRFHPAEPADNDDACPGLDSNEAVSRQFLYVPSDSRTSFIDFTTGDSWPVDFTSIHFLPDASAAPQNTAGPGASDAHKQDVANSGAAEDGVPRPGVWVRMQKINVHDLGDDAATAADLSALTGKSGTATIILGCNGHATGGSTVELRAAFPSTPGLDAESIGTYGSLFIANGHRDMRFATESNAHMTFITVPLTAADLAPLAFEDEVEPGALSILVGVAFNKYSVTADLPVDGPALDRVIEACKVALPPRPALPVAALPPGQVQHLELARIALGMTADQVRGALGSGYRFLNQADPRNPSLAFLGAWGTDSAYATTLIDGRVAAFNYTHTFAPGAQPLEDSVIDGITAKAWSPIWHRASRALWVADADGNPRLKPRQDNTIHPCAPVNEQSFGAPPAGVPDSNQAARQLERVLPRDNGAACGVTIALTMTPAPNGTTGEVSVSALSDIAFHSFMTRVNAAAQQQKQAEHEKLSHVPTPF